MSNSRRRKADGPISQARYMSSPEFAEQRGINGGAVAAKAGTLLNPRKRSLLFFLQAISLRPGGLTQFAKDCLDLFPERIGSPTMHRLGIKPDKVYPRWAAEQIIRELDLDESGDEFDWDWAIPEDSLMGETLPTLGNVVHRDVNAKAEHFLDACRSKAYSDLPRFITELCINPALRFPAEGDEDWMEARERPRIEAARQELNGLPCSVSKSEVPWFRDLVGALFEFKRRFEQRTKEQFVETSISRQIFETLDFCLQTGKPVALEGNERIGKSTALEAWCNLHLGEARLVSLTGLMNRTSVFRSIAKAAGLASSYTRKALEMQFRVEDFFQRSRLVLVIDESHFLLGQSVRISARPELIDWLHSALYNHGAPFAVCATPQFAQRLNDFEKQTGWNAGQFKGRLKRWATLNAPTTEDLFAVAKKLLPEGTAATIKLLVGYALLSKRHMPAIVDMIDEARLLATKAGREKVIYEDVERARNEFVMPSDQAKERAFGQSNKTRALPLNPRGKSVERPLQQPAGGLRSAANGTENLAAENECNRRNGTAHAEASDAV